MRLYCTIEYHLINWHELFSGNVSVALHRNLLLLVILLATLDRWAKSVPRVKKATWSRSGCLQVLTRWSTWRPSGNRNDSWPAITMAAWWRVACTKRLTTMKCITVSRGDRGCTTTLVQHLFITIDILSSRPATRYLAIYWPGDGHLQPNLLTVLQNKETLLPKYQSI